MTDSDSVGGDNRAIMKQCKNFFERAKKAFMKRRLFYITQFEKIRMVYSPGWEYCDSCYTVEGTQEDFVMKCQVCDLRVHQSCYGTRWLDDDEYFICYRCAYLIDSKKSCDSVRCSLCPEIKGAIRPLFHDYTKPWAHKTCLNYKLNCWWEDETLGFLAIQKNTKFNYDSNEICDVCGSKMGTVIKCDYSSGCQFQAHGTCLVKIGVIREYNDMSYQTEKEGYDDESHVIALLCLNHLKKTDKSQFLRAQEFASKMQLGKVSLFFQPNSPEIEKFMNEKLYIQKFRQLQPVLEIQSSRINKDELFQSETSRNRTSRSRDNEKYCKAKKSGKIDTKPIELNLTQTSNFDISRKMDDFNKLQSNDPLVREKSNSPFRAITEQQIIRSPVSKKDHSPIRSVIEERTPQQKNPGTLSTQKSVSPIASRSTTNIGQGPSPLVQREITSYFGKQTVTVQPQIYSQSLTGTSKTRILQKVTQKVQLPDVNDDDLRMFDIVRFYTMTLGKPSLEEIQEKITTFDTIDQAANFLYQGLHFRANSQSNLKEIIKNIQHLENQIDKESSKITSIDQIQSQQFGNMKNQSVVINQVKSLSSQLATTSNVQTTTTQNLNISQQQFQSSSSPQQQKKQFFQQYNLPPKSNQNRKDEKKQSNEKQKPENQVEEKDPILANEPQIRKKIKGTDKDTNQKEDRKFIQYHKKNKEVLVIHKFRKAFSDIREEQEYNAEENDEQENRLDMTLEIKNQEFYVPVKHQLMENSEDYIKFQENNNQLHTIANIYLLKRAKEFYLNLKKQQQGQQQLN